MFFLSLSMLTGFYSCNKPNELFGIWESDDFEIEYKSPALPPYPYSGEELVLRGKMTLHFKYASGLTVSFNSLELFDRKNNITYHVSSHSCHPFDEDASYSYDGKKLTLTFSEYSSFSGQTWTGKVKKTTIDLRAFFGETVVFRQKK